MRCVVQRVLWAQVDVDGTTVGRIERGALVLLGVGPDDDENVARKLANKIAQLRFFTDAQGKMNLALGDVGGGVLVVSQFTLYGDCSQGRRPFFGGAAAPTMAEALYRTFITTLEALGITPVSEGRFGAHMQVSLCNDGPVTLWLDSSL